jgi:hypothetical protein
MTRDEIPWEDIHHRLYFLPKISRVERGEFKLVVSRSVGQTVNPLAKNGIYVKGNMVNISEAILINISRTPDVVKNVFIGENFSQEEIHQYTTLFKYFWDVFFWSYEEIPGIYPQIF